MVLDPTLTLMGATVTGIFFVGAAGKMSDVRKFAATVGAYRLLPRQWTMGVAAALCATELVAGIMLLVPAYRSLGAVLAALLLVTVTAAVQINLWRGRVDIDCGCGGAEGQKLSYGLILRNLALIGVALATAALEAEAQPVGVTDLLLLTTEVLFAITFYFIADQLLANGRALFTPGVRP